MATSDFKSVADYIGAVPVRLIGHIAKFRAKEVAAKVRES